MVDGVPLFRVSGVSAYPPEKRARAIADRIKQVAANRAYSIQALFFFAVEGGAITLSGFEAEWPRPTYRLVRIALIAFALVAAYPSKSA